MFKIKYINMKFLIIKQVFFNVTNFYLQQNNNFFFLLIILIYITATFSNNYKNSNYRNVINVAYAFDKNYHYITHVSMKSIMLSQNNDTFINFYILVSNLTLKKKNVINRISKEHKNCKITFFDMGNQFKEYHLANKLISIRLSKIYNKYILSDKELIFGQQQIFIDLDYQIY